VAELIVSRVSKKFGRSPALVEASLRVRDGSIFGLVGPNGAGKTTLLTTIAGLQRPDAGEIRIGGRQPKDARVGFMPDTPNHYAWLTVAEMLDLAARVSEVADVEEAVASALATFGLERYAGVQQRALSRGLRQRAALAATLMGSPELVVLDEPCSALDPIGRLDVLKAIAALRGSATVIFSTHMLADVERICDEVAIIYEGRVVVQDTVDRLRARAASFGFTIVMDRPVEGLAATIAAQPWCVRVSEPAPGRIEIEVSDVWAAQHGILESIKSAPAYLVALERTGSDLERVLMDFLVQSVLGGDRFAGWPASGPAGAESG
jgi:ABC-2 type transport system ATP-binding protein